MLGFLSIHLSIGQTDSNEILGLDSNHITLFVDFFGGTCEFQTDTDNIPKYCKIPKI